jgi:hypothetical protein
MVSLQTNPQRASAYTLISVSSIASPRGERSFLEYVATLQIPP